MSALETAAERGYPRVVSFSQPAAGAGATLTAPGAFLWEFVTCRFTFTTSATVANREVLFGVDDGITSFYQRASGYAQAASLTWFYRYGVDLGVDSRSAVNGDVLSLSLPRFYLLPGWRILLTVTNIQAGDQIFTPSLLVLQRPNVREDVSALTLADTRMAADLFDS